MKPKARLNSQLPPGSGRSLVQRSARPAPEDNDFGGIQIVYPLLGIRGRARVSKRRWRAPHDLSPHWYPYGFRDDAVKLTFFLGRKARAGCPRHVFVLLQRAHIREEFAVRFCF